MIEILQTTGIIVWMAVGLALAMQIVRYRNTHPYGKRDPDPSTQQDPHAYTYCDRSLYADCYSAS